MGSQSSTIYTPEDGQFMFFNNYPHNKNKTKPPTFNQEQLLDPTGEKAAERSKFRSEYLKSKEKDDKYDEDNKTSYSNKKKNRRHTR
jgi:hypothetical protein